VQIKWDYKKYDINSLLILNLRCSKWRKIIFRQRSSITRVPAQASILPLVCQEMCRHGTTHNEVSLSRLRGQQWWLLAPANEKGIKLLFILSKTCSQASSQNYGINISIFYSIMGIPHEWYDSFTQNSGKRNRKLNTKARAQDRKPAAWFPHLNNLFPCDPPPSNHSKWIPLKNIVIRTLFTTYHITFPANRNPTDFTVITKWHAGKVPCISRDTPCYITLWGFRSSSQVTVAEV
jgi:hypothetical protein